MASFTSVLFLPRATHFPASSSLTAPSHSIAGEGEKEDAAPSVLSSASIGSTEKISTLGPAVDFYKSGRNREQPLTIEKEGTKGSTLSVFLCQQARVIREEGAPTEEMPS